MSRQAERQTVTSPLIGVGPHIRAAQEEAEMTNAQLAAAVGVDPRLVQKWKAGTVIPGLPNLVKLARIFECDVSWFFEGIAA